MSASAKDAGCADPNVLVFSVTGWRQRNRVKGMPIVTGCLLKDTAAVGGELKKIASPQVKVPGINESVVLSPKWHSQYMLQYDIPRLEKLVEVERM